jgi:hypothetical protein
MKLGRSDKAVLGVGAAACVACCAAPLTAAFAAIGLGTVAGFAVFGAVALALGAAAAVVVGLRRRRKATAACAVSKEPIAVTIGRSTPSQ